MTRNKRLLLLLIGLGLILSGCDIREGTIVYDVDFPNADSCDASGNCDDGSGSGSGSGGAGSDGGSDNASPGFTLSKTTATVSETGSSDTFTIVLDSPPSADVVFGVSDDDSDNSELSLSTASLTFGTGNWSTAQTITLTGLDDSDVDGNVSSTVTVAVSSSTDTNYAGLSAQTVSVTTIDNDSAGFTLSQTTATVSETGSTDSFSIVLNNSPTADVSFSLSDNDSDNSELSLSATSLTFGTGNWSTAQTITLTGLDDNDLDGDVVSTVTVSVSSSADTNYAGLSAQTVSVTTQDDELASVTWDAVTPGEQQIELTWLAYSGASSYTIYWNNGPSGSVDNNSSSFSEISGTASTSCPGGAPSCLSYNHGGLDSSAYYYYRIVANVSGKLTKLSSEENTSPLDLSCTPKYTHDNDSDLLVYYDFNNNLEDQIDNYSDGRYDLTNTGGTIRFPAGCGDGLAGYFDSTSGYAYNNNFNDDNNSDLFESGNFTISMWFYADQDMPAFSSLMSSKYLSSDGNDGNKWSWQLDVNGSDQIRWRSAQGATTHPNGSTHTVTNSTYSKSQWTHAAFVKHDNGTSQIYLNGVLEATSSETQNTPLDMLKIGVNRRNELFWKGYIDEFKVYGRALSEQEVVGACAAYTECKIPTNLSVTAGVEQNSLSWDAVSGATDYKIYYNTTGNVDSSSLPPITVNGATTEVHSLLSGGTTYYYRVSSVVGGVESALSVQQSATPLGGPATLTAANNEAQQVTLRWTAVGGASSYTIYWNDTGATVDNNSNSIAGIVGSTTNSNCPGGVASCLFYVHGGLTNGTTYNYRIAAVGNSFTGSLSSPTQTGTPVGFTDNSTGCIRTTAADNDSSLLVYYDFENSLNDIAGSGTPSSPYNLTNVTSWSGNSVSGTIKYAQGCAYGQAAYFDSTTGYLVNEHFDNGSISALNDNYTVSMWLYPETSGDQGRIALNSGTNSKGPDFQLEYKESTSFFEWNAKEKIKVTSYPAYQWYHVALVKHDNGTGSIYVNGAFASSINNHSTGWNQIGMGISRSEGTAGMWKGYIDEVKVYGKSLDETQICNLYKNDGPNNTGATCP